MTTPDPHGHPASRKLVPLTLTAIGVVYGDIGTSPLYAMRECFFGSHSVPVTHANVLGVLSLIIYSLLVVISIKYIAIVMRADNQGEGGILALTALLPQRRANRAGWAALVLFGIFGAALLYGDGMITPAITVLGAVEGLKIATPLLEPYVVPVAVLILIGVFAIQRHGTHSVGRLFGPIMVAWFVTIAGLGMTWHEQVVTLMITTQPVPHVPPAEQIAIRPLGHGVFDLRIRYGFMEDPDVPDALRRARDQGLRFDEEDVAYFLGRETLIVTKSPGMAAWRERLFVLMARNAVRAPTFFRLPPERVVELGVQVEI